MRLLQPKPTSISTFIPPTNLPLTARSTPASRLAALQARSDRSKVDDLSAVSQVLKAQYKRQQASKLQAETLPEEEEKQGKLAHQASKLQAETLPEEEEKQGKSAHQASKLQAETLPEEEEKQGKSAHQASKLQFRQVQGKEDWQKRANPAAIFSGSGNSLSASLMAKYERLMPGVSLGHVKVFQGASVDASLAQAGLQGLTDGTQIAVSSQAQSGTLEHELGHVAQRQTPGFNLNEGSREGYEQNADQISARLVSNQPVSQFQGLAKGKSLSSKSAHSISGNNQALKNNKESVLLTKMSSHTPSQAKCVKCEKEQAKPDLKLAKTISIAGKGQLQAAGGWGDYWQEFVGCTISTLGWLTSTTLLLMKECGATIGKLIVDILIVPLIALFEKLGGGNGDTNPFGWLIGILEAVWHFLNILKGGLQATVVCITSVVGLILSLIGTIWCLISAMDKVISKIEAKKKAEQNEQRLRQLEQDAAQARNQKAQMQQQINQLRQQQQVLIQRANEQQRRNGKQPCTSSGGRLVCP